jgi:hypothetical protein
MFDLGSGLRGEPGSDALFLLVWCEKQVFHESVVRDTDFTISGA